jgi:hypothetical protein
MKKRPSKDAGSTASSFVDDEGVLCLKGDLFWKWRALDAELRSLQLEVSSTQAKIVVEIDKHPQLKELFSAKAALAGQLSVAQTELTNVQAEIEKLLGVSLKDCAFDDKTGRIYNLAADGSRGEPRRLQKRTPRTRKRK